MNRQIVIRTVTKKVEDERVGESENQEGNYLYVALCSHVEWKLYCTTDINKSMILYIVNNGWWLEYALSEACIRIVNKLC
jgi:hypothetical protein